MTLINETPANANEGHSGNSDNHKFRYYSRQILKTPGNLAYHKQRIAVARNFTLNEPLQGAMADMFYGCWFEIPYTGTSILNELKDRLSPHIYTAFQAHIQKQKYMQCYSDLATRWSVLVTPSHNVAHHQLRISSDDARQIAYRVVEELIDAKSKDNNLKLKKVEEEFLAHCMGCFDRIGFSIAWFRLAKKGWQFDSEWIQCQRYLEMADV